MAAITVLPPLINVNNITAIRTFHNQPENSFDVIGYGSSHMWMGFDANAMYEKYGIPNDFILNKIIVFINIPKATPKAPEI